MSRKKIKKDVVKRKTNMYDPMGVYGRGLTQNQRLGMTRQMKIQYLGNTPERINQKLLDEYKKVLQFYKIPTVARFTEISLTMEITENVSNMRIDAPKILQGLRDMGVEPMSFVVNSVKLTRTADGNFPKNFVYYFKYGNGGTFGSDHQESTTNTPNTEIAIPALYKASETKYYLYTYDVDNVCKSASMTHNLSNISNVWTDLVNANVGDLLPFTSYNVISDTLQNYTDFNVTLQDNSPVMLSFNVSVVY